MISNYPMSQISIFNLIDLIDISFISYLWIIIFSNLLNKNLFLSSFIYGYIWIYQMRIYYLNLSCYFLLFKCLFRYLYIIFFIRTQLRIRYLTFTQSINHLLLFKKLRLNIFLKNSISINFKLLFFFKKDSF